MLRLSNIWLVVKSSVHLALQQFVAVTDKNLNSHLNSLQVVSYLW